jgi:hypothetical protein
VQGSQYPSRAFLGSRFKIGKSDDRITGVGGV